MTNDQVVADAKAAAEQRAINAAHFSAITSKQPICRSEKSLSFELIISSLSPVGVP